MSRILVLFYSQHGRTQLLAEHIARGIEQAGHEALIRIVPPITSQVNASALSEIPDDGYLYADKQDLIDCDGLAIGSPTHFGNMAGAMKHFIDSLTDVWVKGQLEGKPACCFTSSSSMHGGQETTLLSMMLPLLHQGMCIVGLPYSEPNLHSTLSGGGPYGPTSVNINDKKSLSDDEESLAIAMGKRLANVAAKLKSNE